jgi:hypothetical protein
MKIGILLHRSDEFETTRYLVKELAEVWRERGHEIALLRDPSRPIEADLAIAHIDLTRVPCDYARWFDSGVPVINGRVLDVSKRVISEHAVVRGDGYVGPVIVKTNRNFGGLREYRLAKRRGALGDRLERIRPRLPWSFRSRLHHGDYRVFASVGDVPWSVWRNPALFVERFLPERDGDDYAMRVWLFFGNRETGTRVVGPEPVVKGETALRFETLDDVPEELRRKREELCFDYGKFDYAIVDGEVVLYDANPTPGLPYAAAQYRPKAEHLASGIESFS